MVLCIYTIWHEKVNGSGFHARYQIQNVQYLCTKMLLYTKMLLVLYCGIHHMGGCIGTASVNFCPVDLLWLYTIIILVSLLFAILGHVHVHYDTGTCTILYAWFYDLCTYTVELTINLTKCKFMSICHNYNYWFH